MSGSFSLRRLSQKELSTVLLCMTHIDRLSYSLCSKRCKTSITELNLNASKVTVQVSDNFKINLAFYDFRLLSIFTRSQTNQNAVLNLDAQQNLVVTLPYQAGIISWNYNGLSCYEWLAHCMEIYHIDIIDKVMLFSDHYGFGQVRRIFELYQIQFIMTDSDVGAELVHGILSLHLKCNQVSINVDSFGIRNRLESKRSLQKAIIQNVENVCFRGNASSRFALPITPDDILLTNASQLSLSWLKLSGKDLNRFLKIWMRSPKQRLKTFKAEISNQPDLNENRIMRGIYHTAIAREDLEEKMRAHGYNVNDDEGIVNEGFNIRSRDGREATVYFREVNQITLVKLFVWN